VSEKIKEGVKETRMGRKREKRSKRESGKGKDEERERN
jgi:hypothetical protein